MALSGDKLADLGLQPEQYDDQAHQINMQPGLELQPGTIPGSAESRQVPSTYYEIARPPCNLQASRHCLEPGTAWTRHFCCTNLPWHKLPTLRSLFPCRDAAGLLVAMARSSHQDAEDQAPQEMHTDQNQDGSIQLAAQDQQHLQAQDLAVG